MNLKESHFQVTNRPKTGFVDARYLYVEVSSHLSNRIFRSPKSYGFHYKPSTHVSESHNSTEWHYQGIKMSNMAQR